jgi:hypothetical protein
MINGCDATTEGVSQFLSGLQDKRLLPDWAGVLDTKTKDGKRPLNILPGDTKLGFKFKSNKFPNYKFDLSALIDKQNPGWVYPLSQVFTYCLRVNVRYGYIITDEEIVALRFSAPNEMVNQKGNKKTPVGADTGTVEWASIKYNNTGAKAKDGSQMTFNLALWWLHLLAANERSLLPEYNSLNNEQLRSRRQDPVRSNQAPRDSPIEIESAFPAPDQSSFMFSPTVSQSFASLPESETSFYSRDHLRREQPQRSVKRSGTGLSSSSTDAQQKRRRVGHS